MIIFGTDIPLVEVIFGFTIISFLLLVEIIIVTIVLIKQMNDIKKLGSLINKLSDTLLQIKKVEVEELDKLKKR